MDLEKKKLAMSDQHDNEYSVKVLIIGDSGVGKSCLMSRYTTDVFPQNHVPTIGMDMKAKRLTVDDMCLKMQLWDTTGQEKFRAITTSYFKGSHGILLVFSYDNRESFEHLNEWIKQVDANASSETCKVLVANKSDLEPNQREVTIEEAKKFAAEHGLQYYETSAKSNIGIPVVFNDLGRMIKTDILTKPDKKKTLDTPLFKNASEEKAETCYC